MNNQNIEKEWYIINTRLDEANLKIKAKEINVYPEWVVAKLQKEKRRTRKNLKKALDPNENNG